MSYSITIQPQQQINRKFPDNYVPGELDFCADEFSYNTNDVEIISFNKAFVDYRGRVYNEKFVIQEKSLVPGHPLKRANFFSRIKKLFIKKKTKLPKDEIYLHCFDEWSSNQYHWMTDFLPKLTAVGDDLPKYVLLLPDNDYTRNVGIELLELFNLIPKRIEWIKPRQLNVIYNLKFIPPVVDTGRVHDDLILKLRNRLLVKSYNKVSPAKRIYITRSKAVYRKVLNETEVIKLLSSYNFQVVAFEDLSIKEQVEMANNADILVSIHGAGLANCVFMNSNSKVVEFRRDKVYHNQCYWHLAKALHLNYYYVFGEPDKDDVIEGPSGVNLNIPLDKLESVIKSICVN